MKPEVNCDVVIVGGGITGLWLSAALHRAGYHAILFEKDALGAGQTLSSQGIIHGGTKYALTGKLTGSSEAVRAMPARWHSHLNGQQQPDLGNVTVNTTHQWMWPAETVGSRIAGFFASKIMSSRVSRVATSQLPDILSNKTVYQLEEPVLDVASLLDVLASQSEGESYRAEVTEIIDNVDSVQVQVTTPAGPTVVQTQLVICTAGAGNEMLAPEVDMQRRGLHMVMVKGALPPLWAHIIEADANPRLTITTHQAGEETIWYLGGKLAEQGMARQSAEQIRHARAEMELLVPEIEWNEMYWDAFKVDRVEGRQADGQRPVEPVVKQQGRQFIVWPTKLAFAPLVADKILDLIKSMSLEPGKSKRITMNLDKVSVGRYRWDHANWVAGNDA